MPGPVSDSYDPEFGTGANAQDVQDAIQEVVDRIGMSLGPKLHNIVSVVQNPKDYKELHQFKFTEQQLRVIRFGLNRALEGF